MFKIKSIYSKIVLTIFAFIITISIVVFAFTIIIRKVIDEPSIYSRELTREIILMGRLTEEKLPDSFDDTSDAQAIENMLNDFAKKTNSDLRLVRINDMKTLLTAYSDDSAISEFPDNNLSEILESTRPEGASRNYLRIGGGEMLLNIIIKNKNGDEYLLQSKHNIYYPQERRMFLWTLLLLCILVIALAAFPISRNITNPINKLIDASQKLSSGEYGYAVNVKSGDEIGRLADNFNEMSAQIQKLHENRKDLLADISHELRTPLTRIQTDAEIIIDKNLDEKKMKEYLLDISEEVKCMNDLIKDLFDLSKIDLGFEHLDIEEIDFGGIIKEICQRFESSLKYKNIELDFIDNLNSQKVKADRSKIKQVLANLMSNALYHTEKGGKITITGERITDSVRISVRDNGKGIPADELSKIFNRFYRVDKSRARNSGGSGLGLAICKKIISYHGGEIKAESKLREGTTVTFTLPC